MPCLGGEPPPLASLLGKLENRDTRRLAKPWPSLDELHQFGSHVSTCCATLGKNRGIRRCFLKVLYPPTG